MIAFFEKGYVDMTFSTRLSRQLDQIVRIFYQELPDFLAENYMTHSHGVGKRFTFAKVKQEIRFLFNKLLPRTILEGDFSQSGNYDIRCNAFDRQILEKGGIEDNMGNIHTTAQSYKNYLKENDLVIKDWTPGSNSAPRKFQGVDREVIARALHNIQPS